MAKRQRSQAAQDIARANRNSKLDAQGIVFRSRPFESRKKKANKNACRKKIIF